MGIQKCKRQTRGQHFAGTLFAFSVQKQSFAALYRALRRHQRVCEQKERSAPAYGRHQSRKSCDKGPHTGRPRTDTDNIPKNATEDNQQNMAALQALPQYESVLRTNRDDKPSPGQKSCQSTLTKLHAPPQKNAVRSASPNGV